MKNLSEVIELSNAAARLLSACAERGGHAEADQLSRALMDKARCLLGDGTDVQPIKLSDVPSICSQPVNIGGVIIGCVDESLVIEIHGCAGSGFVTKTISMEGFRDLIVSSLSEKAQELASVKQPCSA